MKSSGVVSQSKILDTLSKTPSGLTVTKIAVQTQICDSAVRLHLKHLQNRQLVTSTSSRPVIWKLINQTPLP